MKCGELGYIADPILEMKRLNILDMFFGGDLRILP